MRPTKKAARVTGLIYLLLIILGVFSMLYIPGKIVEWGNPSATVNNIKALEPLFTIGFAIGLLSNVCWVFLALSLQELLRPVNEKITNLIVVFVVIGAIIMSLSAINQYAVLELQSGKS